MKNLENIIIQSFGNERYLSMQIDITNACNISCTHCYHPNHKNENALSLNQWFDVINQLFGKNEITKNVPE
jgi:MoaA/NifB/PqqE/SkfB family radical SAM enzyme